MTKGVSKMIRRWPYLSLLLVLACSKSSPSSDPPDPDRALDLSLPDATLDRTLPDAVSVDLVQPDRPIQDVAPPDLEVQDMEQEEQPLPDQSLPPPDVPDAFPIPPQIESVDTRLGLGATEAGHSNRITCVVLDGEGIPMSGIETQIEIRPQTGWRETEEEGRVIGVRAGLYQITCSLPREGLRDPSPKTWLVEAGPPQRVMAHLEPRVIRAGERSEIYCSAEDAEGNSVSADEARLSLQPANEGSLIESGGVSVQIAGHYSLECELGGVRGETPLDVLPASPSALVATVLPERSVYELGEIVRYHARVTDAFGNEVRAAALRWSSEPPLPPFGEGRYRLEAEGLYALRVGTAEAPNLWAEQQILVDSTGPSILCTQPLEGEMLGTTPLLLEGRVADSAGISEFFVDGVPVPLDEEGAFSIRVSPEWGLNVHELSAQDQVGKLNSAICSYFASERYLQEEEPLDDAILLHLTQEAVDDGPPEEPILSLADLIRRVLDSDGLVESVDQSLQAQNPILPERCQQRVLGYCVFTLGADYEDLNIRGPNTLEAELEEGGIRVRAWLRNLDLGVQLRGTVSNAGTITVDSIFIDLSFGVSLRDGRPQVLLLRTHELTVGDLSSEFEGAITGALLELVFWAFEGMIRNEVTAAIEAFLSTEMDAMLSGVFSGLDLESLGMTFNLPSVGGLPETALLMSVGLSSLDTQPERMRIGIQTSVSGPSHQARPSAGIPIPPGPEPMELTPQNRMAGAIHLGFINQLLHQAWRAGLMNFEDASALAGDLPEGSSFALQVINPPALRGIPGSTQVEVHLGPALGEISYPGLFEQPLGLKIATWALTTVTLEEEELRFGEIQLSDLRLSVEGMDMSPEQRAVLEELISELAQSILDHYLNGLLPSFPIPDFALPETFEQYGVPAGSRLGLREPVLEGSESHLILHGRFQP